MANVAAFMPPDGQSEYAFPASQGTDDNDPDQAAQRNQQIQAAFDAQRFQRGFIQNIAKSIGNESAQIARLRQQQAQQKT
jgi:hypothetical protein